MGVPTIGCRCAVCTSTDPRDNRMRTSVLLSRNGQHVVIDTTPDFRSQALRVGIEQIEAVLLTHGHADHVMGFDDLRPLSVGRGRASDQENGIAICRREWWGRRWTATDFHLQLVRADAYDRAFLGRAVR